MKIVLGDKIGVAEAGTMKAYRQYPGDFTTAAKAARKQAAKLGKPVILVPGKVYNSKVWHMAIAGDSLLKFGILSGGTVLGAHVAPNGEVHYAELTS